MIDNTVDVHQLSLRPAHLEDHSPSSQQRSLLRDLQSAELLPGRYEDWGTREKDKWQRLRLSVLEHVAELLLARGDFDGAMEAACAAIFLDPLRESVQRLRLQCYLEEGNTAEALHAYRSSV
jgi:SARP family transcriptional regulator, regulator of embCAB operon